VPHGLCLYCRCQQVLATFAQGLLATFVAPRTVLPIPRDDKWGRRGQGTPPDRVVYQLEGALAMRIPVRHVLIDHHSCVTLATNELDDTRLSPQELLAGYKGQAQAERGFRFLKDSQFLASSLYLKKPERMMALLMVMTVCLLVYAGLEDRIRHTLKEHEATFPDQTGERIQNSTARWVFHYFVGIHLFYLPQQWPILINLTEGAPAPAPTPGKSVCLVLQMNIPQNQRLGAECR
jgi:hypothetical protein